MPAAPRALAEALGIRLEFVRDVSSAVTSSQERRQFCFIAHGRESFSETLLQEVPSGRAALPLGDEAQRFSNRPVEADRKGREKFVLYCLHVVILVNVILLEYNYFLVKNIRKSKFYITNDTSKRKIC